MHGVGSGLASSVFRGGRGAIDLSEEDRDAAWGYELPATRVGCEAEDTGAACWFGASEDTACGTSAVALDRTGVHPQPGLDRRLFLQGNVFASRKHSLFVRLRTSWFVFVGQCWLALVSVRRLS